jgi:predicted site-specific integrase-resolvase
VTERLAYRLEEAAEVAGVSLSTIRRAVKSGALVKSYLSDHPVIYRENLVAWIESAPTERASA